MAKNYSEADKAAVLAALLAGQSVSSIAKEYKIPKGTISSWQKREAQQLDLVRREAATHLKKDEEDDGNEIGGLLATYLKASLRSLINQVEVMGEKDFIRKQEMQQIAVGHGVQMDKAIRLIEAMNRAESASAED